MLPLHENSGYELRPSYRSSVVEGGKPILRGGEPEPDLEYVIESPSLGDMKRKINEERLKRSENPQLVRDFKIFINWLITNYGYNILSQSTRKDLDSASQPILKPRLSRGKRDTRDQDGRKYRKEHDEVRVLKKRFRNGAILREMMYASSEHRRRSANNVAMVQNSGTLKLLPNDVREPSRFEPGVQRSLDENWKTGLKDFMKDVITRVSRSRIDSYVKPVIKAVERDNNVTIVDVDVDKYGHIFVDYVDETKPHSKVIVDKAKTPPQIKKSTFVDYTKVKRKTKRTRPKKKKQKKRKTKKSTKTKDFDDD